MHQPAEYAEEEQHHRQGQHPEERSTQRLPQGEAGQDPGLMRPVPRRRFPIDSGADIGRGVADEQQPHRHQNRNGDDAGEDKGTVPPIGIDDHSHQRHDDETA